MRKGINFTTIIGDILGYNSDAKYYKLDTVRSIESIPVPTRTFVHKCDFMESIEYVLQRKATQYKKEGRMDLAIACLRKSNQIMPYSPMGYQLKDYARLIKYLAKDGQTELAKVEEQQLKLRHPELYDYRISNKKGILQTIKKCKEWKNDLVCLTINSTCPICKNYNNKIYSLSGKSTEYPPFPQIFIKEGGLHENCFVSINVELEL